MPTILIVDDREINRKLAATVLSLAGHRVLQAEDGPGGLELARRERPDLALVDILMPGIDGFQFVQALRADPAISQTRIVFYSAAYREAEALALARRCGVTRLITKPAESEQILRTVAEALGKPPAAPAITPEEFTKEHQQLLTTKVLKRQPNWKQSARSWNASPFRMN